MKRNIKSLILAVVVLALLVGLYAFAVSWQTDDGATGEDTSQEVEQANYLADVEINDIESIQFNVDGERYTVINAEPPYLEGYVSNIIDTSRVISSIYACVEVTITHEIENPKDLSAYGLDDEKNTVVINLKDGSEQKIVIGSNAVYQDEYYAMNKTTGKIGTVPSYVVVSLMKKASDFRGFEPPSVDNNKIEEFIIEKDGRKELAVKAEKNETNQGNGYQGFYIMTYPHNRAEVSAGKIKALFELITTPQIGGIIEENPKDLEKYGLDKPYVLTVTDNESTVTYKMGKYADGANVYFMCDDVPVVFSAYCEFYDIVKEARADDYTDKFIGLFSLRDVAEVKVEDGAKSYSMTINDKDAGYEFQINKKTVEADKFSEVYQLVVGLSASEFTDEIPAGEKKCTITFTFRNKEKKTFTYYNYNERNCIVKSGSGRNCFVLTKDIEKVLAALK